MAKRNLLLVDSDSRSLRVLEVSLRKAGYSVTTSADVDGALELIELTEPDMILADTRLPGKDGFALVAALKVRRCEIPLVFLSSDPSVESRVRGLELGVEDYLTKPVYIREILTRVNLVMQRKEREGLSRTSKTRFAGALADMGLVDLLQTIDVSRKSGVLHLVSNGRSGKVYFYEGRVIDAELGDLSGEAAIYRFLLWSEGEFELDFRDVRREDKLGISTQGLLMEGMRRLDEVGRLQEQLPPMGSVLDVSHQELALRLAEIPDEINDVLRLFDGRRTLGQVLEESHGDDLATLNAVNKLFFEGFLVLREAPAPEEDPDVNGDLLIGAWEGATEEPSAAMLAPESETRVGDAELIPAPPSAEAQGASSPPSVVPGADAEPGPGSETPSPEPLAAGAATSVSESTPVSMSTSAADAAPVTDATPVAAAGDDAPPTIAHEQSLAAVDEPAPALAPVPEPARMTEEPAATVVTAEAAAAVAASATGDREQQLPSAPAPAPEDGARAEPEAASAADVISSEREAVRAEELEEVVEDTSEHSAAEAADVGAGASATLSALEAAPDLEVRPEAHADAAVMGQALAAPAQTQLAAVKLKRVAVLADGRRRATGAIETVKTEGRTRDPRDASDVEPGEDGNEMAKRAKRASAHGEAIEQGRASGVVSDNVIQLPVQRSPVEDGHEEGGNTIPAPAGAASKRARRKQKREQVRREHPVVPPPPPVPQLRAPTEVLPELEPDEDAGLSDASDHESHKEELKRFFSKPPPAPARDDWSDLEVERDPLRHHQARKGQAWTLLVLALGALSIGGFLVYNKLLLPSSPAHSGPVTISLPTPDMMRNVPPVAAKTEQPSAVPARPGQPALVGVDSQGASAAVEPRAEDAPLMLEPVNPAEPAGHPATEAPAKIPAADANAAPSAGAEAAAPPQPEVVTDSDAESFSALLSRARKQGLRRSAESSYLQALTIKPRATEALSGLAMLYLNQGKTGPARDRAREAIRSDGANSEAWIVLGAALSALGDADGAKEAYAKCAAQGNGKYVGECRRMLR